MPERAIIEVNGTEYTISDVAAVKFDRAQTLTATQRQQARANIQAPYTYAIAVDYQPVSRVLPAGTYRLHNENLYVALVDIQPEEVWDSTHWLITSAAEELTSIQNEIKDIKYVPIEITMFSMNGPVGGVALMGATISGVNMVWNLNKKPTTQTLNGVEKAQNERSATLTGLSITTDQDFVLQVTDSGSPTNPPATAIKTITLHFCNYVIYGKAALSTVDSVFVNSLSSKILTDTKARTITVNAGSGQYIWYAVPKRLGTCNFNVGGFDGGFEAPQTVSVTNSSGHTEDYYVYRSTNASLGNTTVKVT